MRKVELAVDQQLLRPPLLWGEIPMTMGSGVRETITVKYVLCGLWTLSWGEWV